MASILPPLNAMEALETSMIQSVAGLLGSDGIQSTRPFREPRHTASMAAIVGGGKGVQFETQEALYASASYSGVSLDTTSFAVYIVPSADVSLEDAEAALDRAIGEFIEEGVDEAQLNRLKTQYRAAGIYAQDNVNGLANAYGRALTSGLTLQDIHEWPDIIQSITAEEILAAARDVFDLNSSVTGWIRK